MFSKKLIVVALAATSLVASAIVESSQSSAQAKPIAAVAEIQNRAIAASPAVSVSQYGPTCTDGSSANLISGTTRTQLLSALNISCVGYLVNGATVPVTPVLVTDGTTLGTPFSIANPTPQVTYSVVQGSVPIGITATIINNDSLEVVSTAGAIEGTVTILATQTYVEDAQPGYAYSGITSLTIPVSVKVPSPPTCRTYTVGTVKNVAVDVPLLASVVGDGGCKVTDGYGDLTFTISALVNADTSETSESGLVQSSETGPYDTYKFDPDPTFLTPKDNSIKASFSVIATDAYGQISSAYNKANVLIGLATAAPFFVNVNAPRNCSTSNKRVAKTGVIFNDPRNSFASEYQITNAMIGLIDCAQPGSYIAMSWFSMTDENFVNHLIQAYRSGVTVRVLLNSHAVQPGSASYTAYSILKKAIGTGINANNDRATGGTGSWISYCRSGCLTPKAPPGLTFPEGSEAEYPALHSKFFMFNNVVGPNNKPGHKVIGISSVNPTYAQAVAGFNNASIVVDDNKLFSSMSSYYQDLANSARTGGRTKAKAYRPLASNSKTTTYTAYPLSSGGDDIVRILKNVKCVYRENGVQKRTKIYVNMFVFTRNSPAKVLWRLANETRAKGGGCEVHIIYTDMDQRIRAYNTKTKSWGFIPVPAVDKKGKNIKVASGWGVADCLSTPATANGKVHKLSGPGLSWDKTTRRYVQGSVCNFGTLNGRMPTINKSGGYCWLNSKSKVSGGSLDACVSTPLAITSFDPADGRAKLEAIPDSKNRKWYSHQKYIAIDGMYAGKVDQVVISGTPNVTSPGIRWNDEILTFTTNKSIYKAYFANFQKMKLAIKTRAAPARNPLGSQTSWSPR